ncbi:MAG: hypothetical protein IIY21_13515 [Clostridiales bacterium]|nr:hypothetical protein [Clostridiales bacterium]MBQ1571288.1 hypothetical protein [Clostridiales bacterium]
MDKNGKKTNADKLREMTDSELTDEIYRLMGNAAKCPECFWKSGRERLEFYMESEARD